MRVTFAGASRPTARAAPAAAGAWADARAGVPASMAPTTPLSDFAKLLRSSAIFFPLWRVIIAQLTRSYDGSSRGPSDEHRRARDTESRYCFAGSNDSVRLKNGITCSWKRTATSLVCVPG